MREIGRALLVGKLEIVGHWRALSEGSTWLRLPPSDQGHVDLVPEVVVGIIEASLCAPADMEAHRKKVWAAAAHGEQRRTQGLSETTLLSEFSLLRQAFWSHIRGLPVSSADALEAVSRIDMAISLATMASLYGYHREELEGSGQWPSRIEQLVGDSPLLRRRMEPQ